MTALSVHHSCGHFQVDCRIADAFVSNSLCTPAIINLAPATHQPHRKPQGTYPSAPLRLDIAIGMAHMLLQLQKVSCFDNYEPHTRQGDATGPGRRSDNVALSNVNGICRKRINHFPRAPWVCAPNGMRSASLGTHPVSCLKRVASVGPWLGLGWSSARTVRKAVRELSIMKATFVDH
jgi:hypothetical protein